ncbi:MAG: NAD(P)H-binding protein [Verrucomicrobia bacterium]|nr:NAD(P)H-binding protein [Verrucomicrobiota bacterium]
MKIAITGGTGFVGGHLARALTGEGHEVVIIARGSDRRDQSLRHLRHATFQPIGTDDEDRLVAAFTGCDAVAHCAGINRESGAQTYARVHAHGTQRVVNAARRAGVRKLVLVSFLRARPACGSGYHESKFAAEEIVRGSGLDYTVLKPGVIYGRGDHMLDHLSHAFHTFPVFGLVGFKDQLVRPLAIADLVHVMRAAIVEGRLSRQTVAVTGPEEMTLGEAVRRVARAVGKRPLMFRLPLWFHYALAWLWERTMTIPLVSLGQVRILSEGVVEPLPACGEEPEDLKPRRGFSAEQIRAGLPEAKAFGWADFHCLSRVCRRES